MYIWVDQYNNKFWAESQTELKAKYNIPGRIQPMFQDKKDGTTVKVGCCIGQYWFTQYAPVETPVK